MAFSTFSRGIRYTGRKVRIAFQRSLGLFYSKICAAEIGAGARFFGMPLISNENGASIRIGKNCTLASTNESTPMGISKVCVIRTVSAGANIIIGDNFGGSGCTIVSACSIVFGNGILMGSGSVVIDTDFHPINVYDRYSYSIVDAANKPIVIEDNVFIGANALVLKGVKIGKNSVVAAGAIVTKDIPENVIVAGNPAKIIGTINISHVGRIL